LKKLKLNKRKVAKPGPPTAKEFPVMIATPFSSLDKKVSTGLCNFVSGAVGRRVAIPYMIESRAAEFGRNAAIRDFLGNPEYQQHDYLMFLDADTVPMDPFAIETMMAMDKDVVSGVTPIFIHGDNVFGLNWNVRANGNDWNMYLNEMSNKPFIADKVGGSCMLIKRAVLEALEPPYQKPEYDADHINFAIGEDYYFCNKIRQAGFDIWVNPEIQCHHYHTVDLMDMLKIMVDFVQIVAEKQKESA